MLRFILALTVFSIIGTMAEAKACKSPSYLKQNAALLESSDGTGLGSGVLYQADIMLTTYSNTKKAKDLRAYIPAYDKEIDVEVLYSAPRPDLAVLKLAENVSETVNLKLARKVLRAEPLKFLSFPFNNRKRLGMANSKLNTLARFSHDTRLLYFNATLDDWAFYGDNGGSFFNCGGELVGIHFGPLHTGGKPDFIYGANMRAIEDAIRAAGVPVRREY